MALLGTAFNAIWHDFEADWEAEYEQWHTIEHMPERLSIPGFLFGRRYVNRSLPLYRWLTLYQTEDVSVFTSEAYLERLNNPTEWSLKIHPHFLNFLRCASEVSQSVGVGYAQFMSTTRIATDNQQAMDAELAKHIEALSSREGISGVHIGLARPEATNVETAETKLRGVELPWVYDVLILIEGISEEAVGAATDEASAVVTASGLGRVEDALVFELAYALDAQWK